MISNAKKLVSLTTVGAGALALTPGKAEAANIIVSGILDVTVGFSSNAQPANGRHTAATHIFNTFSFGPQITFRAVSFGEGASSAERFVREYGAGFQLGNNGVGRFSAGARMNTATGEIGNGFDVGNRQWGSSSTLQGLTSFTDKYFLFRFQHASVNEYGWMEASMSVTQANSSAAADGPNLTVIRYAFDDTGALISAGDINSPEPSSFVESGLAALFLGAEGLRRWRKRRQAK